VPDGKRVIPNECSGGDFTGSPGESSARKTCVSVKKGPKRLTDKQRQSYGGVRRRDFKKNLTNNEARKGCPGLRNERLWPDTAYPFKTEKEWGGEDEGEMARKQGFATGEKAKKMTIRD